MGERVIAVSLRAQVAEFERNMLRAADSVRKVGTETEKLQQQRQAFEQIGRASLTAGAVMAAGIGMAVKKFAEFDQAMSNVAATGQDARSNMQALTAAAIEAGAKTVYSATESANAIEEMAKAGVDAKDVLGGGLAGALDLAAAGGLGVADAAGIAAVALKTFKLEGSDMSHVADLLAAGAGKAMGDVTDLSQALRQGGQAASLTGLSIEETTAALSAFASQGLLGSDAGTSLKTMLLNLNPTTDKATALVEQYNLQAFDQQGNFIGLAEYAGKLQAALGSMSAEQQSATLKTIFGTDAYRAAAVVLDEGESGIRDWISAVDDQGYAAETARTRLDNLKGDIEALSGAVDSAMITMGSAADGPLRIFVQGLTSLVDTFNELPAGAQQAAFGVGAVTAAGALALGTYLVLVPKIAEFKVALATLGPAAQRTARVMSILGRSLGAVGIAAVALSMIDPFKDWVNDVTGYTDSVKRAVGGTKTLAESLDELGTRGDMLSGKDLGSAFEGLAKLDSNWFSRFTSDFDESVARGARLQALLGDLGGELGTLATSNLPAAQAQFRAWSESTDGSTEQLTALLNAVSPYRDALDNMLRTQGEAVNDTTRLKLALGEAAPAANDAATGAQRAASAADELQQAADNAAADLDDMKDALDGVAGSAMSMADAKDAALSAINSLRDAADEEKASLKGTNDESIKFREAIRNVEQSSRDAATAILENGGSVKDATKEWRKGRDAVVDTIEPFFKSRDAAEKWADKNLGSAKEVKGALGDVKKAIDDLPEKKELKLAIETAEAMDRIQRFIDSYNNRKIKIGVSAETIVGNPSMGYKNNKADGGAVFGPGTETSDSIPAMLSNNEHVLTAADVRAAGGHGKVYAWRKSLHSGVRAFASGGAVTKTAADKEVREAEADLATARRVYEAAKSRRDATKKDTKARAKADKALDDAKDDLEDAKREASSARQNASRIRASFRSEQTDWRTGQRRGENFAAGTGGNGLQLVDQLFEIAADMGGKAGKRLRDEALRSEEKYLKLEKSAKDAAKELDGAESALTSVKDAAVRMASAVADRVRSLFDLGALGASKTETVTRSKVESQSVTVGGRTYQWDGVSSTTEEVTTKPTAGSFLAGSQAVEARIQRFGEKLKALADRKFSPQLLEELALMGVENGEPIVDALLGATDTQVAQINASYGNIGSLSALAGQTVADANFAALITEAQKDRDAAKENADEIKAKLETETTRIITKITDALRAGVKKAAGGPVVGPGTSTSDSIRAWLSDGENVWDAASVDRWGGQSNVERLKRLSPTSPQFTYRPGGTAGSGDNARIVMPETLVIRDQDGQLIGRMRVEADRQFTGRLGHAVQGLGQEVAEW